MAQNFNEEERTLMFAALLDKANGDRKAADEVRGIPGHEWLVEQFERQANMAEGLAERIEGGW